MFVGKLLRRITRRKKEEEEEGESASASEDKSSQRDPEKSNGPLKYVIKKRPPIIKYGDSLNNMPTSMFTDTLTLFLVLGCFLTGIIFVSAHSAAVGLCSTLSARSSLDTPAR
jgi:hypothetical protein